MATTISSLQHTITSLQSRLKEREEILTRYVRRTGRLSDMLAECGLSRTSCGLYDHFTLASQEKQYAGNSRLGSTWTQNAPCAYPGTSSEDTCSFDEALAEAEKKAEKNTEKKTEKKRGVEAQAEAEVEEEARWVIEYEMVVSSLLGHVSSMRRKELQVCSECNRSVIDTVGVIDPIYKRVVCMDIISSPALQF